MDEMVTQEAEGVRNFPQESTAQYAPTEPVIRDVVISDTEVDGSDGIEQPVFSFAVITDVQYADIPDGHSFRGVPRYYRHSLEALREAVSSWNSTGSLNFGIHLGDIVDGHCPRDESQRAVEKLLAIFNSFQGGPFFHIIGNHCLYNLPRIVLNEMLAIPPSPDGRSYYEFSPSESFRIIILDGYDVSALGWPPDHPHTALAKQVLDEMNPNTNKDSPEGLRGPARRFVKYNGGVGKEQLAWLEAVLKDASNLRQKVIICCHLPLHPGASSPASLLWNYYEVLLVLHSFKCVVACLSGHAHRGGHVVDSRGIHHRVFEAVLECPPGTNAFGHINVYPSRLVLVGSSGMASIDMPFRL